MPIKQFGVDFPAASLPLDGTEALSIVQGGVTVDATTQDIADLATATGVTSVVAGTGITVDNTTPSAPVVAVKNAVNAITPAAGVATIDCALGDYFTLAPTANVTSIVFTNLPGSGKGATKMIRFTQDTTPRTVAWPASFKWAGGVAGTVSTGSGAIDVLAITTFDNGTTWDATLAKAFA